MGERAPVALLDAAASARLAIAEAITNIACAPIAKLGDVKLSANWMAAAGRPGEDARLYDAVRAAGVELCPALGIAIPGRQGLDVDAHDVDRARRDPQRHRAAVAGGDARSRRSPTCARVLTPELWADGDDGAGELLLVDLGRGKNRLGGSALAQVYGQLGAAPPDLDDPALLKGFFAAVQELAAAGVARRVPRSQRRRPVRDAGRDGVRGRRRPGHRDRRPGRRSARRPVRRGAGRGAGGARRRRRARARGARQRTASATPCARSAHVQRGDRDHPAPRRPHACSRNGAASCAASGRRRRTRCRRCATTRPAPTRSRPRASTARIRGCRS